VLKSAGGINTDIELGVFQIWSDSWFLSYLINCQ